ncbi:MAG: histidinol-phosphate transaminase [Deferribacterales bacterium]
MSGFDHGGNIYEAAKKARCSVDDIIDLSSNISPFTPEALFRDIDMKKLISRLPEPYSLSLISEIAKFHDVPENTVLAGNGTTEFIHNICSIYKGQKAVILQPTYVDYIKYAQLADMSVTNVVMTEESGFSFNDEELMEHLTDAAVCFICNPNNPTGKVISKDDLRFVADVCKNTLFVIDESYVDFCVDSAPSLVGCSLTNVAVLRSFSKSHGIPGLRAGYIVSRNKHLVDSLNRAVSPWNMNTPAQEICKKAVKEAVMPNLRKLDNIKHQTMANLSSIDQLKVFDSAVNFFLIKLKRSDAQAFCEYMLSHHFLVRDCSNFVGLNNTFIRIAMKEQRHMDNFCRLAKSYFEIF